MGTLLILHLLLRMRHLNRMVSISPVGPLIYALLEDRPLLNYLMGIVLLKQQLELLCLHNNTMAFSAKSPVNLLQVKFRVTYFYHST